MKSKLLRIDNCSEQDTQNLEEYIRHLYGYIKNKLQFKIAPLIKLIDDEKNSQNPLGQTGHYDPDRKKITVFITDRHIKDVLRSIAHELIHHNQNCNNKISGDSDMSEGYAQRDQDLRNLEEEAYSLGNMYFRDWEDEMKKMGRAYESLDNFRTKQQKLLTEAVYSKFGFSTKFLKEAEEAVDPKVDAKKEGPGSGNTTLRHGRGKDPNIDLNDNIEKFLTNNKADTTKAVAEILRKELSNINNLIRSMRQLEKDPSRRTSHYPGKRIRTISLTPILNILSSEDISKEDTVPAILGHVYRGIGTLMGHFQTVVDDEFGFVKSSTARFTDPNNIPTRKQPWGKKSLALWLKVSRALFNVLASMAVDLILINPSEYRTQKASLADLKVPNVVTMDYETLKAEYTRIINEIQKLTQSVQTLPDETPDETAPPAPGTEAKPAPKRPKRPTTGKGSQASTTKPAPPTTVPREEEYDPGGGLSESRVRKNTENILRLLESLTKGKK
jgi:hypothetical protein